MSGQHTPGPWEARPDRTVAAAGVPLLRCYAGRNEEANARLIAAAPELLEALKKLSDLERHFRSLPGNQADAYYTFVKGEDATWATVRAAISKASNPNNGIGEGE